jgi:outer membrane protein TolC
MNIKRINLLVIFAICSCLTTYADERAIDYNRFTLKQAIEIGLLNNKELQNSQKETEISIEKEKLIFNQKLPEIGFSSSYKRLTNLYQYEDGLFSAPTTYEPAKNVYEFNLDASVPVYLGGRLNAESHKSKMETHLSELKTQYKQRIIKLDIVTAFLHIYHLMEQQKLVQDKMKEDSLIIKQADAMRRNGASTKNEVLRTQLQLSNHRMMLSSLKNDIIIGEHQLQTILSLTDLTTLHIDPLSIQEYDNRVMQANDQTTGANNDELLIARSNYEIGKVDKKVVASNVLPQISLIGNYGLSNPNYKFYPPQPYFYRMGMIGVSLKYSISALYKNKAKTNVVNLAISQKQLEMEQTNEKVSHALFAARQKLLEADERIQISLEAIEQAKENYRMVKQKYIGNLSLITELIDADNAYLEAESALITNQIDKQLKQFQLQYILGNL